MCAVDEIAARFRVLTLREAITNRPHAAADAVARLDDGDCRARAVSSRAAASPARPAPAISTETPSRVMRSLYAIPFTCG